jgi:hypothetical protein
MTKTSVRAKAAKPASKSKPALKTKAVKSPSVSKTYCVMCPTWEIKRPERCSNTHQKGAKTLYFCTRRCKDKFLKTEKSA